ncbi:AAA family ATPase [Sinorhizobium psoraleae]|uniref:AAA family ATPase n=1 Tax=Sinorhizobium psoraleae TaxID=520838 RepID=UPI0015686AD9|nr:AAA family ATPase [Sinorhizobium psoraleae]
MRQIRLIVTAGLPGSGKSIIAEGLARAIGAPVLSVDPIEAAMWRSDIPKYMTGIAAYEVAAAVAEENLKLGLTVIVDAVNPVEVARATWVDYRSVKRAS